MKLTFTVTIMLSTASSEPSQPVQYEESTSFVSIATKTITDGAKGTYDYVEKNFNVQIKETPLGLLGNTGLGEPLRLVRPWPEQYLDSMVIG